MSATTLDRAKQAALQDQIQELNLLGQIITWNPGFRNTYTQIITALRASGLDERVARQFLPRQAMARACKELADQRVIDVISRSKDEVVFQFTKKQLDSAGVEKEMHFVKETYVTLDVATGKISCKDSAIQELAQKELDRCTEERTGGDISNIVKQLLEDNADIFSIRDQGGVYFVPKEHLPYLAKVGSFLEKLGGGLRCFSVPKGDAVSDASVTDVVSKGLQEVLDQHRKAVAGFTLATRDSTIEECARRIQATRVKAQAYASYLAGKQQEVEDAIVQAQQELKNQVEKLTAERAGLPPSSTPGMKRVENCLSVTEGKTKRQLTIESETFGASYNYLRKLVDSGKARKDGQLYYKVESANGTVPSGLATEAPEKNEAF